MPIYKEDSITSATALGLDTSVAYQVPTHNHFGRNVGKYNIIPVEADHYLEVGNIPNIRGWVLYLSVNPRRLNELVDVVAPLLLEHQVSFKFVKDESSISTIINGGLGFQNVGKMICIYPTDNTTVLNIARQLILLTEGFQGPVINTARKLGSIVYTRFGAFRPVSLCNDNGDTKVFFIDDNGIMDPEDDATAFKVLEGQSWPFQELIGPEMPARPKLLNSAYLPYLLLVGNVKGNVKKGKYFKHWWQIKNCLIKQGKQHMFVDEFGRDIRDRLRWQFTLNQQLNGVIPMPKVFDFFYEYDDAYLAMEFIHGPLLGDFIQGIYQKRAWFSLPKSNKIILLETVQELIHHIAAMHEKGFVHRDITPVNFIMQNKTTLPRMLRKIAKPFINEKKKITFIDLELSWNYKSEFLMEPFQAGTPGFMSREQEEGAVPTIQQDIFSLGALMIIFFTGLPPTKFYRQSSKKLEESLTFLIRNKDIVELVVRCMSQNQNDRPAIEVLQDTINRIHAIIQKEPEEVQIQDFEPNLDIIKKILQASVHGLVLKKFLSPDKLWFSKMDRKSTWVVNDFDESIISDNLYSGLAGILYQVASLQSAGVDTSCCTTAYEQSWLYIQSSHLNRLQSNKEGYYFGSAGISLSLLAGLKSHLLEKNESNINFLRTTLSRKIASLDWATGISGQLHVIIQLLKCRSELKMSTDWAEALQHNHVTRLIKEQSSDGSWRSANYETAGIETGWRNGVAGITAALLEYLSMNETDDCIHAVQQALVWLQNQRKVKKGKSFWHQSTRNKAINMWELDGGIPGIALCFLRAYEYFKDQNYLTIAEETLEQLPIYPNRSTFSLEKGLAGLGFVYKEAYRITRDEKWKKKADYILLFFLNTFNGVDDGIGYWFMGYGIQTTPDLFTGVNGILFLLNDALTSFKGVKTNTIIKLY